ncbi:MAG TPA: WD40 repeat domain-containing protein [Thermoanaerobaculia bacterium]
MDVHRNVSRPNEAFFRRLQNMSFELRHYGLRFLPATLVDAGNLESLQRVLTSFWFLQAKLAEFGPWALITDYELSSDSDLSVIRDALRLSAHFLAVRPIDLAGQLLGRLVGSEQATIQILVSHAEPPGDRPWLRPLTRSLAPPGQFLVCTFAGHAGEVNALALTPDGKYAVSASDDGTLKVWDSNTGNETVTFSGHASKVTAVAITPDGLQVVSGSADGILKLWDIRRAEELLTLRGHTGSVNVVAVTADGRRAVSAAGTFANFSTDPPDHTIRVWDLTTGAELRTLRGHTERINALALLPDDRRVISAAGHTLLKSTDNTLRVWDLDTGMELQMLNGHSGAVVAVVVTPDGRYAVSAGGTSNGETIWSTKNNVLKVWDLGHGSEVRTIHCPSGPARALAITPEGRHIVSIGHMNELIVWDLDRGIALLDLPGAGGDVLALTPDGEMALTSGYNKPVEVWHLGRRIEQSKNLGKKVSAQPFRTLIGHESDVLSVAVMPDGRRVLSGSFDHTVKIWDLHTARQIQLWPAIPVRSRTS